MNSKEVVIKSYMSQLGKKSAHSPIRTKAYYSELGKRSADARKRKKKEENSPSTYIYNVLTGKV